MTASQTSMLSEIADYKMIIPEEKLAYFRERQRNRLYDFILKKFKYEEQNNQLSKADLARRLNRKPEQITRWLATPGNWTMDTISDLMLAIYKGELEFNFRSLVSSRPNYTSHVVNHASFAVRGVAKSTSYTTSIRSEGGAQ